MRSPSGRILSPGANFPALLFEALREADARGNLSFDAQIAAVCREHGATQILTHDRDFTRFSGLRIVSTEAVPGTI
jgi:predicted nucleic acid-binding protein